MKKNTKKKLLALALIIGLLSIAIVGGSLAWFTAADTVENVYTIGSIGVQQLEKGKDGTTDFQQNQTLLPVLSDTNVEQDPNFIYKRITVENTDANAAYVRTWIAIPSQLEGYLCLRTQGIGWTEMPAHPTGEVDGISYTAHCYVYAPALEPGTSTTEVLTGVYLDPSVDLQSNSKGNLEFCKFENGSFQFSGFEIARQDGTVLNTVQVLAATQAVQAANFTDAQSALNTGFGEPVSAAAVPFFSSNTN